MDPYASLFLLFINIINIDRKIKSRRLRWANHLARMEEGGSAFKMLTGKPTGKRHLGRPMRRWGTILEISISMRNWD